MHNINGIKTIGIVGGGQLARMMIPAIRNLGLKIVVLDPSHDAPVHKMCDHFIVSSFFDPVGFDELAKLSDVITYEFEHISVELLKKLESEGKKVYPSVATLQIIQDKFIQNSAMHDAKIPGPAFRAIANLDELQAYYNETKQPFMLKARRNGYDGKGNYLVKTVADIVPAFNALSRGNENDLMAEELVDFCAEVSVIATRGQSGECVTYPIAENSHKDSILDTTTVPANITPETAQRAHDIAKRVLECFKGVGTFGVELFVTKSGEVLVNETAPRVHNSGHYTIEACRTSQFENHIRAIVGIPLGSTDLVVECVAMKNIIGERGTDGIAVYDGALDALKHKNLSLHIYGKSEVLGGRKMGHYTVTGSQQYVREVLCKTKIVARGVK
jgi:5-(carboxyamino)imidazole ribonucleotide synthase